MRLKAPLILLCISASVLLAMRGGFAYSTPTRTEAVNIQSGMISGILTGDNNDVRAYKGIPFAAPPVGDLRWKPPQPPVSWTGVRACDSFGPACPQPNLLEKVYGDKLGKTSEDCLYLNVWAPIRKVPGKLPVMVWIHGGGYTMGSGSSMFYDGTHLAEKGVVIVTINYRLGPFGFLAHPLLTKESPNHSSGNYGLLDQIAALRWVRRNITAFGGDPGNVTIFGESAGAGSVCFLMSSPLARGLFQRAIAESGSAFGPNPRLAKAESVGSKIAERLGCDKSADVLAAMRSKSADELLQAANMPTDLFFGAGDRMAPIVDGWVVPDDPTNVFAEGKETHVPLLVGANDNEGAIFTLGLGMMTARQYEQRVRQFFGPDAGQVLALYPAESTAEAHKAMNQVVGDYVFVTPARMFASFVSKSGPKAFLYHFTRVRPGSRLSLLGAYHGSEIPYVFDNVRTEGAGVADLDRALADVISSYWVEFARTGDPNFEGAPRWPAYDGSTDKYMELGDKIRAGEKFRKAQCDLFAKIIDEHRPAEASGGH